MMVQVGVMRGARRELRETVPTPRARDLLLLVLDCSLGQYARESSLVGDLQIAGEPTGFCCSEVHAGPAS